MKNSTEGIAYSVAQAGTSLFREYPIILDLLIIISGAATFFSPNIKHAVARLPFSWWLQYTYEPLLYIQLTTHI